MPQTNPLVAIADILGKSLGTAVSSYNQAAAGLGRGEARRPKFLDSVAEEGRWKGGNYLHEQDAAALRSLQNSWIYMIIQRKAMEKSAAQLYIVDNPGGLPNGGTVFPNHDLLRIFANPNPHMDGQFLSIYMDWWLELLGQTFLFLAPDAYGSLSEIWPLPANRIRVVPGDSDRFIDYYEYTANGIIYRIPAEYVYHEMYPNPFDVFNGLSPLVAALLPADADSAMAFWNGAFFGEQNVMPSSIVTLGSGDPNNPIEQGDLTALKAELNNEYSAVSRKTLFTNAQDMSVALLGWNAKDMDFLAGRSFTKEEIILIYGGFPGMFDKNATEANATVSDNMFKEKTIWPSLGLRAGRITNHILRRFYSKSHQARYVDIRPINRTLNISESDASAGILTIDERRKRFWNASPLPDRQGEVLMASAPAFSLPSPQPITTGSQSETRRPPESPVIPNQNNALPDTAQGKSLSNDLRLWKMRSIKSLTDGRPLTLEFKSSVIPSALSDAILDGLQLAENPEEVREVFSHAALFSTKGIISSWRPWSGFENEMARELEVILSNQIDSLLDDLRSQGSADALNNPTFWAEQQRDMTEQLKPVIDRLAAYGASRVQRSVSNIENSQTEVNWDLTNSRATEWAQQHAAEMVRHVTDTSRELIRDVVKQWSTTSEGIDGLKDRLLSLREREGGISFNQTRAEMIAVTEATNIYAGANSTAWAAAGYSPAAFKPSAHVRCRCYLQPFTIGNADGTKSNVMVWFTARDERVCSTDIETPFGVVGGCADLHRRVVSEGPHLGEAV